MSCLSTPRLLLPAWQYRYGADLARMSSDERVMRYVGQRPWPPAHAALRHSEALAHWVRHGFGWRAVLDRRTGRFLGLASLTWLHDTLPGIEDAALEIGWWTEPHAWGRGVATEAARALLDEAFHRVRTSLVVARCDPANAASERVMVKLGMTRRSSDGKTLVYALPAPDGLYDRTPSH